MPPSETTRTENDAIIEQMTKLTEPVEFTFTDRSGAEGRALAVMKGVEVQSVKKFIDEYRDEPERRKGTAYFYDLASFIAHANRFKDADSAIFARPDGLNSALTSVLNYHRGQEGKPRFGDHRGVYKFPISEEWEAWTSKDDTQLSQADFAELVENRILDVADPASALDNAKEFATAIGCSFATPTKLIELSRGLSLRVDAKVQSASNLATGEAQIQYVTQHQDETGAPLKVPGAFLLVLPVFKNGAAYQIPARLRYRHRDGKITWFYELYRTDRVFDHAFKEACDAAAKETGLPLFLGNPET